MAGKTIWGIFIFYLMMVLVLAFVDFSADTNEILYNYGLKTYRLDEVAPDPNSSSSFYREGGWILNGYRANYLAVAALTVLGTVTAYLLSKISSNN